MPDRQISGPPFSILYSLPHSGIIPPMLSPQQIESRLERILLKVQKPGRYVGGEWNSVLKDWEATPIKVALAFPDIYDIGISNLGLQILYDLVNQRPDALAERAYAPWVDMEEQMRANAIPLYSLETKHALADFDILGFSLPYETLYTNVLNMLDLAGIPLRSSDRTLEHPLVIAGGHACFNPEPMYPFIDAFVIGEGEEVIQEIIDVVQRVKGQRSKVPDLRLSTFDRDQLLWALAQIPGVYVPRFYDVTYLDDGTIAAITPNIPEAPRVVLKRMVAKPASAHHAFHRPEH